MLAVILVMLEFIQSHIKAKINGHFYTDKKLLVFLHFAGNYSCKSRYHEICFKVIDTTSVEEADREQELNIKRHCR